MDGERNSCSRCLADLAALHFAVSNYNRPEVVPGSGLHPLLHSISLPWVVTLALLCGWKTMTQKCLSCDGVSSLLEAASMLGGEMVTFFRHSYDELG